MYNGACQVTAFWYVATKLKQQTFECISTSTHSCCHTVIHAVLVQTRIIPYFISALRSTYIVWKQAAPPQAGFAAAGHAHTARLDVNFRFKFVF